MRSTDNFFERKREWSRLKDRILGTYLRPYLAKIAKTRHPILIVDCFAGKGRFDDGEAGSPLLICEAIEGFLQTNPSAEAAGLFIEKKYFRDLKATLHGHTNCEVLPGTYEQHMATMNCRTRAGMNVLLFVDPYGIKSLDMSRFKHLLDLRLGSLEVIMNFATFGFLREGCRLLTMEGFESESDSDVYEDDPDVPNSVERMNAVASGSYWQDILRDYHRGNIDMKKAEAVFASTYLEHLRSHFPHVVDIPVQYRRGHLPKYRLIHATASEDGLLLMADNMSRVWREFVNNERGGQRALFEEIDYPDMTVMEGYSLEEDVLSLTETATDLKSLLLRLVSRYGITFSISDLTSRLKSMGREGDLTIQRFPATTSTGRLSTSMDYRKYRIMVRRT